MLQISVMPFFRALISVFTLFGGHFLNRRVDRVVLIGALAAVAVVGLIGLPYALFFTGQPEFDFFAWALRLPLILIGALSVLSAGLTFRDARLPPGTPLSTTMRASGAALSLVGLILLAAAFLLSAARLTPTHDTETGPVAAVPTADYRPFYASLSFGGNADPSDLPAPPSGPERLRGRISLEGVGAAGVELYVILNGKYKVEHLTSNSHGAFETQLPAGSWKINSIVVNKWNAKPKGRNLILLSGHEPMKTEGPYSRYGFFMKDGLEISLPSASDALPVQLELRDALPMAWPPLSDSFGGTTEGAGVPDANFSTASIGWQGVKGASEYEVQIAHVTREGTSTRYTPILMRRLPGLTLQLASLPQRQAASEPGDEYSVHVYAFDAQGALLTENSMDLGDRVFRLAGATRLGKEQLFSSGRRSADVISAEYETNDLRLSLAAKLLDQKQLDDARRLLDQVTKDAPRGRATALRGKLAALQGDCMTATRLFDMADAEGGAGCAPIEDRNLCVASQK